MLSDLLSLFDSIQKVLHLFFVAVNMLYSSWTFTNDVDLNSILVSVGKRSVVYFLTFSQLVQKLTNYRHLLISKPAYQSNTQSINFYWVSPCKFNYNNM